MPPRRRRDRFGVLASRTNVDVSPGTRYWNARVVDGNLDVRRAGGFDSADRQRRGSFGGVIVTGDTQDEATAKARTSLGITAAPRAAGGAAGRSSGS